MRERVDYDIYYKASREETEEVLREAEEFIQRLEKAIKDIVRKE